MTTDQKTPGQVLLPCPFCGEEPMRNVIEPHTHHLSLGGLRMPDHSGSVTIECGCGAGLIDDTDEAVTTRWNTRAHDRANQPAASGVPEGWKLVPIEATQSMTNAASAIPGIRAVDNVVILHSMRNGMTTLPGLDYPEGDSLLAHVYRSMLAAAPEAPKP